MHPSPRGLHHCVGDPASLSFTVPSLLMCTNISSSALTELTCCTEMDNANNPPQTNNVRCGALGLNPSSPLYLDSSAICPLQSTIDGCYSESGLRAQPVYMEVVQSWYHSIQLFKAIIAPSRLLRTYILFNLIMIY